MEHPCTEKYFCDNGKHGKYTCEVWIPVIRKDLEIERGEI